MNFKTIILLFIVAYVSGKNVPFDTCVYPASSYHENKCLIIGMSVNPCPHSSSSQICDVNKPSIVLITLEYIPYFEGNVMGGISYYTDVGELLLSIPSSVCRTTNCPLSSGYKVNSTNEWAVGASHPDAQQRVKVKLWNDNRDECCAMINLNFQSLAE